MASKYLTSKQTAAIARALSRRGKKLPATSGGCVTIRKIGKSKGFGVLPNGGSTEVCRIGERIMVTMHTKRRRK